MTTSSSNTSREVARFAGAGPGLLVMPCMRVGLSISKRTLACSRTTDIGVSECGYTDFGMVVIAARWRPIGREESRGRGALDAPPAWGITAVVEKQPCA